MKFLVKTERLDTSAKQLHWYGRVLRKGDSDWVKKCMEYEVKGATSRGRPKKTWTEVVQKTVSVRHIN